MPAVFVLIWSTGFIVARYGTLWHAAGPTAEVFGRSLRAVDRVFFAVEPWWCVSPGLCCLSDLTDGSIFLTLDYRGFIDESKKNRRHRG